MKSHNAVWTPILLVPLLTTLANAQQCPAGVSNPAQLLNGTTWTFQTQAAEFTYFVSPGVATIGKFSARQTGPTQGTITFSETVDNQGSVTRYVNATGQFSVYPDCSGGTLTFITGAYPVQYEFVFVGGFSELYLSADWAQALNRTEWGTAKVSAPSSCPAGSNPLSVIDGTTWTFHSESVFYVYPSPNVRGGAVAGIFKPTVKVGNPVGALSASQVINVGGSITRANQVPGLYQVDPDCSGGQLTIIQSSLPIQYAFVFIDNTFAEMYLLADSSNLSEGARVLEGHAKRF